MICPPVQICRLPYKKGERQDSKCSHQPSNVVDQTAGVSVLKCSFNFTLFGPFIQRPEPEVLRQWLADFEFRLNISIRKLALKKTGLRTARIRDRIAAEENELYCRGNEQNE